MIQNWKKQLPELVAIRNLRLTAQWVVLGMTMSSAIFAQSRVNVSIDLSKAVNVLTDTSLGVPALASDANSFNPATLPYLRAAGITAARYPGNHGVADLYHWSTKTTTRYRGADPGYFAPESNFGSFALFAEKLGQAVIVVNYGANFDGNGGGEPAEAAAWVAYANGDAADTKALGKDSTGQDWHTVGYWAALRGQSPLTSDDGLNFLRIQHPKPFGFRLWQIGDQVYNNGYYGGDHTGNPDLHGPAPTGPKDFGKLKGNEKLSPTAFTENLKLFAQAMKAVDPSIQIGAAFVLPPDPGVYSHDWAPDWDKSVLKGACPSLDFVTLEWTMQTLLPPDWKTLDESDLLTSTNSKLGNILTPMLDDYRKLCPKDHFPRLAFAPAGIANWVKVEHPVVKALWVADTYAVLVESGTLNSSWNEMYGDSMLSADRKTMGPAFYGFQMLHILAHSPGDALLDANSNSSLLSVHATHRRDGYVGLMLVNKNPKEAAAVKVTLKNGTVGSTGKRFDYGSVQFSTGAQVAPAPFTVTGNEFTITVPPYTITDILLPGHN
ncbi:MAG: hypothetical protein P4M04_06385 [Acidobacteriota bacterium]|nr:hypothetical protein [Acidobacteriota bacterium]